MLSRPLGPTSAGKGALVAGAPRSLCDGRAATGLKPASSGAACWQQANGAGLPPISRPVLAVQCHLQGADVLAHLALSFRQD